MANLVGSRRLMDFDNLYSILSYIWLQDSEIESAQTGRPVVIHRTDYIMQMHPQQAVLEAAQKIFVAR